MRRSTSKRDTKETQIEIKLKIDGTGKYLIKTPIAFLSHMLENFSKHGMFDLTLRVKGDVAVDQHHTVEDIGIILGQSFKKALKTAKGINRTGSFAFPMDDSLGIVAVDLSGRPLAVVKSKFKRRLCGDFDTDLLEDFFQGFSAGLGCNVAVYVPYGRNDHHKIEAVFKAFGKALDMACQVNKRLRNRVLSTKEVIDMAKK